MAGLPESIPTKNSEDSWQIIESIDETISPQSPGANVLISTVEDKMPFTQKTGITTLTKQFKKATNILNVNMTNSYKTGVGNSMSST